MKGFALPALCLLLSLWGAAPAWAVRADEMLPDAAQEARARALSAQLRCLVCQNQSIDESDAGLARDLRLLVRDRIKAGDSNDGVLDFLVARYGEFVLLKPRFEPRTVLLWALPFVALGAGIVVVVVRGRTRDATATAPLTGAEQASLDRVLAAAQRRNE